MAGLSVKVLNMVNVRQNWFNRYPWRGLGDNTQTSKRKTVGLDQFLAMKVIYKYYLNIFETKYKNKFKWAVANN